MAPKEDQHKLTFVVTTNPNDANSAANKRRVRSVAALQSWPGRRKRTIEQYEDLPDSSDVGNLDTASQNERPKAKAKSRQTKPKSSVQVSNVPRPSAVTASSADSQASASSLQHADILAQQCVRERTPDIPCPCWRCRPESVITSRRTEHAVAAEPQHPRRIEDESRSTCILLTPPSSPSPPPPVSDMADPFNCYPVPYRPWYDSVLHHMLTVFAPRGWPALKITRQEGLRWEWFMTQHALSEPALFNVRLLFATGDMIRLGVMRREVSYWLQDQAIKAINEALSDSKRAISDPLILAVGRIALHESMYGDRQAANTIHRPAQRRMIEMRGGMKALDFPELVKRLMRWADRVMAMQGGTERFLEDDDENKNFTLNQAVNVSETWFPSEGQDLRKRIPISELTGDGET